MRVYHCISQQTFHSSCPTCVIIARLTRHLFIYFSYSFCCCYDCCCCSLWFFLSSSFVFQSPLSVLSLLVLLLLSSSSSVVVVFTREVNGNGAWSAKRTKMGGGVAQRRLEVRTPPGAQETFVRVFPSQNVVLTRCPWVQPPVCIRTHKNVHVRTLKIM